MADERSTHIIIRRADINQFIFIKVGYDPQGYPLMPKLTQHEVLITVQESWDWVRGFLNAANNMEKLMTMKQGDPPV